MRARLLAIALAIGCGGGAAHAPARRTPSPAAPTKAPTTAASAPDPRIEELCAQADRMFCDYTDEGEVTFDKLSKEDQQALHDRCVDELAAREPKELDVVSSCLGCLGECSGTMDCLTATDDGCPDPEDAE